MGEWDTNKIQAEKTNRILSMIENELAHVGFKAECALLHPKDMTENEKEMAETLTSIYKIAHGFNEDHPCWSSHEDWRNDERNKLES